MISQIILTNYKKNKNLFKRKAADFTKTKKIKK